MNSLLARIETSHSLEITIGPDDRRLSTGENSDETTQCSVCDRKTPRVNAYSRGWRLLNVHGDPERICPDCL